MDDPVPMPALLEHRPDPDDSGEAPSPIHLFDPVSQSAPGCPDFEGVRIYPDFLSEGEADAILETIDTAAFLPAQSGKQKQHYGPKINFNKRKMNTARFAGLPGYARELEARMRDRVRADASLGSPTRAALERALAGFETTDVFVLRYRPEESSNLDFHVDDTFAYGELILDLSLESNACLSFLRGRPDSEVDARHAWTGEPECVRVPLPARSLAILYGPARVAWEHALLAYDIESQRTSITLRTLSRVLRETESGREVVERARRDVPLPG